MASERPLSALLIFATLLGSSLLGLAVWVPSPASAAPSGGADSWSDSFEAPSERAGISVSEDLAIEGGFALPGMGLNTGTGSDGDKMVSGTFFVDGARTCVTASTVAGQTFVLVGSASGLFPRDEVLIIQMTGPLAGSWEFAWMVDAAGLCITLDSPLKTAFTTGVGKVQLLRVPQFRDVTVQPGGVLTCSAWDGNTGGVLCFRASGNVVISAGGAIDATGKGFPGGAPGGGGKGGAGGGAGPGGGDHGGAAGLGGVAPGGGAGGKGGYGAYNNGADGGAGGGSGSASSAGGAGKGGAGAGGGAPGESGCNTGAADFRLIQPGSGGGSGQGGNGGAGAGGGGGGGGGHDPGTSGAPGEAGGNGGAGGSGGAGGGILWMTAGAITVEGSLAANGASGTNGSAGAKGGAGGKGGNGGPAGGQSTRVQDGGGGGGGNGGTGGSGGNGGGSGAGGSIRLTALTISAGQVKVTTQGGAGAGGGAGGAAGSSGPGGAPGGNVWPGGTGGTAGAAGQNGGAGASGTGSGTAGGPGLILFESVSSTGVTQPAGLAVKLGRAPIATLTSIPVTPASLARWASFNVNFSLETGSSITFELIETAGGASLGKWAPPGSGRQSFNISGVNATSIRLKATLVTNGDNKPSLADWSVTWVPNHAPNAPAGLSVDGHPVGSPWSLNLTSRFPVFNWSFDDPDSGQAQGAFNLSIWSGPGGTGTLMWRAEAQSASQMVTYGSSGSPAQPLLDGTDYYITMSTRDAAPAGTLWGPSIEMRFHINSPPGVPAMLSPVNGYGAVGVPAELEWSASADVEGGPLTYEWQASTTPDFTSLRANGTSDRTGASVDLAQSTLYYWRVRASDGYRISGWSDVWHFTVTSDKPPRISPIPAITVYFNRTRELDLTPYGSDEQDGNNLTWTAALTDGPDYNASPQPLKVELSNRLLRLTAGSTAGAFTVTLKASDSKALKATGTLNVTVAPPPPSNPPKITLEGSTIKAGGGLRIDLFKHVTDEEPDSLRWEAVSNNTLVTATIENGKILVLTAGKIDQDTAVTVTLKVYDRYDLSDEVSPQFTVTAQGGGAGGEGLPWMLMIGVLVIVSIVALVAVAMMKRSGKVRAPAAVMHWDKDALEMEDRPSFRGGPVTGLDGQAPAEAPTPAAEPVPEMPELEQIVEPGPSQPAPSPPPKQGKGESRDLEDILAQLRKD